MSGQVVVYDHSANKVLDERRDHKKYVVKVASWAAEDDVWVATAGWDGKVLLYLYPGSHDNSLGAPVGIITSPTKYVFENKSLPICAMPGVPRQDYRALRPILGLQIKTPREYH